MLRERRSNLRLNPRRLQHEYIGGTMSNKASPTYIRNRAAKLAPGHSLPTKPVYWMIWVLVAADSNDRHHKPGTPFHSRVTTSKLGTPREAARQCYGTDPTENMLFFNMTS